MGVIR